MVIDGRELHWKKSARCDSGACVEAALGTDSVILRDSKDPDGPRLAFERDAWVALLDWLKRPVAD